MGVKDLWSILSPVGERKSLWELQDKTIAIDLSCWICDSQTISEHTIQPRMYLRNLFFRTSCLLLLGAHPVFVLEGTAPELKHKTIAKRNLLRKQKKGELSQTSQKGNRSRLVSLIKQCHQLLKILGVVCVQSSGEAEAHCALLNKFGFVDGCVTQDGDCFLYGAETVYRNFTISPSGGSSGSNAGYSIDVYTMTVIKERLNLGRNELIAISLLCGCDYNEKGVTGVGKESVMKYITAIKDPNILNRLRRWRTDPYFEELESKRTLVTKGSVCERCGHSGKKQKHDKCGCSQCGGTSGCSQNPSLLFLSDTASVAELNIRKKALSDPDFPSEEIILEFYQPNSPPPPAPDVKWEQPDIMAFIKFSMKLLNWTEIYALEKFLPLVTRWQVTELCKENLGSCTREFVFVPHCIVKKRTLKGIASFEIQWFDQINVLKDIVLDDGQTISNFLVTTEPQMLIQKAYPGLVDSFLAQSKTKVKAKKGSRTKRNMGPMEKENNCISDSTQMKLDKFLKGKGKLTPTRMVLGCNGESPIIEPREKISRLKPNNFYQEKKENEVETEASIRRLSSCFSSLQLSCSKSKHPVCRENLHISVDSDSTSCFDEDCSLCFDNSNSNLDLSAIIDGIVNKNNPSIVNGNPNIKVDMCQNENSTTVNFETFSDDCDEFDRLALEDRYVPLIDRIRSQL